MDVSRYFEYDEDALLLLGRWLRLDEAEPKTIVEVGCGSGFFTDKLVRIASELKKLVAVEPDDVLREYAKSKLSTKVEFIKGTAEDIPFPDDFADLTICHIVLSNLPNVHKAVSEMARITKRGGIVSAIEPGQSRMHYCPDPKLDEMEEKTEQAFGKGIWNLRSKVIDYSNDLRNKNARYAEVFHSCGLVNVEVHGILSAFLLSDPRRKRREILLWLKKRLSLMETDSDRVKVILQRGGLSEPYIKEYYQTKKNYLKNLIKHPEQIARTHELQTYSRTVTVGFK
jgi:SAM-dependent methyltransferase